MTPDSKTVYAVGGDSDDVTPITGATRRARPAIPVGYSPAAIAISRSGADGVRGQHDLGHGHPGQHHDRPAGPPDPGRDSTPTRPPSRSPHPAHVGVVVGTYAGRVALINTRTRHTVAWITVGSFPVAAAVAG